MSSTDGFRFVYIIKVEVASLASNNITPNLIKPSYKTITTTTNIFNFLSRGQMCP